jgi:hypothetical protein
MRSLLKRAPSCFVQLDITKVQSRSSTTVTTSTHVAQGIAGPAQSALHALPQYRGKGQSTNEHSHDLMPCCMPSINTVQVQAEINQTN